MWVSRSNVVVLGVVARGCHKEDSHLVCALDRVIERLRVLTAAPRVVGRDDVEAPLLQIREVIHRSDRVRRGAASSIHELAAQEFHLPADAGNASPVAARRADRARHVRAMVIIRIRTIVQGRVVVNKIPAVYIIDEAVPIVVDAVVGDLKGIYTRAPG